VTLVIAFSGTRRGMKAVQQDLLSNVLQQHFGSCQEPPWLLHGDCVGADAQAHAIAKAIGYKIGVFPPDKDKYRAFVSDYDWIGGPLPYLVRDELMIKKAQIVYATPNQKVEIFRGSGTWFAIRRACDYARDGTIFYPDGDTEPMEARAARRAVR